MEGLVRSLSGALPAFRDTETVCVSDSSLCMYDELLIVTVTETACRGHPAGGFPIGGGRLVPRPYPDLEGLLAAPTLEPAAGAAAAAAARRLR